MTITIFHNPDCGTSRNVLAIIRHAGLEPDVIEYLKTPPTKERLRALIADMGIPVGHCCARRERLMRNSTWPTPPGPTTNCSTSSAATRS